MIELEKGIILYKNYIDKSRADQYLSIFTKLSWEQKQIKIFGKWVDQPRLVAFYGDSNAHYKYSGQVYSPKDWTKELFELKQTIETLTQKNFNSVLVNYYRTGQDYMGWHRDNEKELGINPWIVSVNFGACRDFLIRKKVDHHQKIKVELNHGDILVMRDEIQTHWEHSLPKRLRVQDPRVNLTFRKIITPA